MPRPSTFLSRIKQAATARQAAEQRRVTEREQRLHGQAKRREKIEHDRWKIHEATRDLLYNVAQVLGGVVNSGGPAVELVAVPTPIRFDITPGTNGVEITARWSTHEVERTLPTYAAAMAFVQEATECAVAGRGPAPRRKPSA